MLEAVRYIGLDVGACELAACVIDAAGNVVAERMVETSSSEVAFFIQNYTDGFRPVVGIEAGSPSAGLARKLRQAGYEVHVFDTRQASKFLSIRRNKTDINDARGIADIVRLGRAVVNEVYVKSIECQHLRSKLVMRQKLIRQRVGGETAIGALFRLNHGRLKSATSAIGLRRIVLAEVERINLVEGIDLAAEVGPVLTVCEDIRTHIKNVDRELRSLVAKIEICRRFMEIPGVGLVTALSFYSAVEDPHRFSTGEDVGAYFGLTPLVKMSGNSKREGGISRMGNRLTRAHLVIAANVMLNLKPANCAIYTWASGLAERVGRGRARAALARKLAVVMLSMWKSGQSFQASGKFSHRPSGNCVLEEGAPTTEVDPTTLSSLAGKTSLSGAGEPTATIGSPVPALQHSTVAGGSSI